MAERTIKPDSWSGGNTQERLLQKENPLPSDKKQSWKYDVFCFYLETQDSTTPANVDLYAEEYEPLPYGINEFEKRRLLLKDYEKLEKIRKGGFDKSDKKIIEQIAIGDYDFQKKGFPARLYSQYSKPLNLNKKIKSISLLLKPDTSHIDLGEQIIIPIGEAMAEQLSNKFESRPLVKRLVYYVVTYHYSSSEVRTVEVGDEESPEKAIVFVETAKVKKVEFFLDINCTKKIATMDL
jgi:hypothetical protein